MTEKNRGGRPRQKGEVKLAPLNMRTDPELREKIEEAAESTGRSLTQEVERRLRTSFIFDERFGGQHIHALTNMLGATIQQIEMRTGKRWTDDEDTWRAVQAAAKKIIAWDRPETPVTDAVGERREQLEALGDRAKEAKARLIEFRKARPPFASLSPNNALAAYALESTFPVAEGRDDWTDKERKQEAALMLERVEAENSWSDALQAHRDSLEAWGESLERAKEIGEAEAKDIFDEIGPRRKQR